MTKKKRLLILNGSHSEIPLIQAARKSGFHVITSGNAPHLIGHQYADEYCPADYSHKESVLQIAKNLKIDNICSCANDFGAIISSYVAEKMGLPGHDPYDITRLLHHKDSFKKFALKNNLPTPFSVSFVEQSQALKAAETFMFPVIIKPVDLTGGKGVSRANNYAEYHAGIKNAFALSRNKRVVVEDFFHGTQHSFSSFLVKQKVVFSFSDNEYSYKNPYYVSTSAAPAIDIHKYETVLIGAVEKIAKQLNLTDGIFHIQYLANGKVAKIIDITRRCSGDFYPYPVNYATKTDWASWIIRAETGQDCLGFPTLTQTGYCGRHCVMSKRNGTIKDVIISDDVKPYIYNNIFWWKAGDIIDNYLAQKAGIVFLQFNTMGEMLETIKRLPDLIQIELE
ncbi:MAG: acetyl-CoA carboxylase biotin carboxylase subunit family protein [Candidatus Scalindua sp.]